MDPCPTLLSSPLFGVSHGSRIERVGGHPGGATDGLREPEAIFIGPQRPARPGRREGGKAGRRWSGRRSPGVATCLFPVCVPEHSGALQASVAVALSKDWKQRPGRPWHYWLRRATSIHSVMASATSASSVLHGGHSGNGYAGNVPSMMMTSCVPEHSLRRSQSGAERASSTAIRYNHVRSSQRKSAWTSPDKFSLQRRRWSPERTERRIQRYAPTFADKTPRTNPHQPDSHPLEQNTDGTWLFCVKFYTKSRSSKWICAVVKSSLYV